MKAEHFSTDIQEFLRLLARHEVEYLIGGGEAIVYYGHARLTVQEFWGGSVPQLGGPEELSAAGLVVQFAAPPNRIDLVNDFDGVCFREAWCALRTWVATGQKEALQVG